MTVAPAPSDAALVARLRSRDRTAWEDVYALYGDRLYKFAYHLAGNPHDAADLVQETFVRVLPKLDALDPDTLDLGAYLFATQRNLFLKQVERAKRQQPVDEIPEPDEPRPIEDDPQRSLLLEDQQERVRRANAALAPRQRLVLALRELEDRSYAEIGELVGLKENAVAQLISRARLRLREELRLVEVDRSKLPAECQELLPALSAYLDGQLSGAAAERTLAHVESCENCQKTLGEMREASKLYRALLPIPFPELFGRIDDALASRGVWDPTSSVLGGLAKSKGAWLAAAAVVGSLVLVAVLGALALRQDAEPAAAPVTAPVTTTAPPADTTAPELTLPQQTVVREATNAGGAPVSFVTRAQDGVDGAVVVTCSPASGETFAIGVTEVSCSAQDAAGNESDGAFEVEVTDSTAPALSIPVPLTVEAKSPSGAAVSYRTQARDRVDRTIALRCAPAGGEVFPLGETTVECTARDAAGNVARKSFKVTVVDSTAPELTLPESIAVEAGARATYKASARDTVDGPVDVECSVPSGRVLRLGQTIVECTSEDAAGNVARKSFVVRVGDTTAPTLRLPDDLTVEATGPRTRVSFTTSAREKGGSAVPVRCRPASRTRFRLGVTTVRCSATDPQGNVARGSFDVDVIDSKAPLLVAPGGVTAEATGAAGAKVDFVAKASDRVDRSPSVTCAPTSGSTFPLGTTNVRCSARDDSGNRATATISVNVVDTTAPVLTLPPNRTAQATSTRGAPVSYTVTASDLVDGPVTPTCTPASGATFAVGTTPVTCTARDKRGNQSTATFAVTVTPFPQPDLAVAVTATSVTITNRGNAAAGVFTYTIQGVGTFTVRGLAAGASITRAVSCASILRTVTVDPQNQVGESNEANNTARIPPC